MSILIGADIVPTKGNLELFIEGRKKELLGKELVDIVDSASFRVFNLEVPLTDFDKPIKKEGPNMRAPERSSKDFKAIGADLLVLANNHILDQGEQGLESTIRVLDNIGINHIGAGANLQEADKAYYYQEDNTKYGFYACAEHEFSIAKESSPGANPFDLLQTPDRISKIKAGCDYLIVLYHGGKEYYRYPSPELQRICRKLVEKGADLVVC